MFREEWRAPQALVNGRRRIALTGIGGELAARAEDVREQADAVEVILHAGQHDYAAKSQPGGQHLWNGSSRAPVALLLRDKNNFADLTGLARQRAVICTNGLHVLYPAVKLADGTLIAGHRGIMTDGDFVTTKVTFNGMRLYPGFPFWPATDGA